MLRRDTKDPELAEEAARWRIAQVASLDGPADENAAQEWDAEVSQRLDEIDAGTATLINREEFSQRMRKGLHRP
jgi:hypothetical protein